MKKVLPFIVAAALIVASCATAGSTTSTAGGDSLTSWKHYPTLEEIVARSDLIVRGRVDARTGVRDVRVDPRQRVPVSFTESRVSVDEILKGVSDPSIIVVQVGKEGDPAQSYPEFPLLQPGDTVLLFLADISKEPIHADGGQKYGIVSPEGLFEIRAGRLMVRSTDLPVEQLASSISLQEFQSRVRLATHP